MPTITTIKNVSFNPQVAQLMADAFEAAWEEVKASGSCFAAPFREEWTRETLALRIIELAQAGELSIERLRDDAIASLKEAARLRPA
jgi:hypothetical protein